MKKLITAVLTLLICISACMPALAGHIHTFVIIKREIIDGKTHHLVYQCDYDLCGIIVNVTEAHKLNPLEMKDGGSKVAYECPLCRYRDEADVTLKNWMLTIPSEALISQINLPGSFHSATKYSWTGNVREETQYTTIPEQMNNGVRLLHMELEAKNGNWQDYNVIYDGYNASTGKETWYGHWEEMYFSNVADYVNSFLDSNPTETIVIILQRSEKNTEMDDNMKKYLMTGLDRERSRNMEDTTDIWRRFDAYRPGDPVPKLGDVRGRCIVLYYGEDSMTYYADMDGQTESGAQAYEDYVEGLMDVAMQPYFNGKQDYTKTDDKFCKENLRYLTNPGEPSVKLVTYDGYMNKDSNHSYKLKEGIEFSRDSLIPAICGIDYKRNAGSRIGWVLTLWTGEKLSKAIISSNARIGEVIEPEPEDTSTDPIDYGLPLTDWLAYMPDNAMISQINLPGTHDSGTRWMYAGLPTTLGRCQSKSIPEQLNHGVRVLDLRLGSLDRGKEWDHMRINHNGYACYVDSGKSRYLRIDDVLGYVNKFLDDHPSETVVMLVVQDEDKEATNERIRTMKSALDKDRKDRTGETWPRINFYTVGDQIPTLGKARGTGIVIWDDTVDTGAHGETGRPRSDYSDKYLLRVHDKINWIHMATKEEYLKIMQDYTRTGDTFTDPGDLKCPYRPGDPQVRYVGYNGNTGEWLEHGPEWHFDQMESELLKIKPRRGKRVGWVAMDFPRDQMIYNIINSNRIFTMACRVDLNVTDETRDALKGFGKARLLQWTDADPTPVVVDTIDASAWQQGDDPNTFTAFFRIYNEDQKDGGYHYAVEFPNAGGYDYTEQNDGERDNDEIVSGATVHTLEVTVNVTGRRKPPKTGDTADPMMWGLVLVLATAGIAALGARGRKRS